MKSTNYHNTFIEVAEDCPVLEAEVPKEKGGKKTVPLLQFEMIAHNPYKYTSDEVLFSIFALRNAVSSEDDTERKRFFSKGQACFRASPLGKRYGWGFHFDENAKMALYAMESEEYREFKNDKTLEHTSAMRSKRK